ncbi:unnamed protein product [Lepeophtheirus salmonis]|uniref:(salmon louse) hypothetical protein n=2 Tax=Lepeophtheirus salmonis TaxID=72036 RepID=A0A0K2TMQ8_LEPSM|nr:uncharacterized protein LOC121126071 isoform X2 [Lepeophtheirus salmonis]XP_040577293.1 uncharacterized protein LOC121126071 isoform X2 [Lepeophtheirus salmonis]XP_040577294.1 uncharacterized protein LOC121126071 isoform X2 [Lepeophtheirus salmonis]XP_040577295.1 uncharacterized protein LOC121126071 isoform X2 [Lepeophtheirus salmonis]CAB4057290.1 unnamed protein product [Lepeophtheirus salmonis]CAF2813735.1 unnamed protein product [Lepeophtheirus salmonis]
MSSTWSLKLPNLLLKKIRGSKEPLNQSNHNNNNPTSSSSLSIIRPYYVEDQLTRDCKEFYERRVHLTSKADDSGPSSLCSSGYFSLPYQQPDYHPSPPQESQLEEEGEVIEGCRRSSEEPAVTESEEDPLQSKILHLRKEFLSLIEVDNQLFKQLLNLNDAIQDFKELHNLGNNGCRDILEDPSLSQNKVYRSKSFLEDTKTFQRQRISFPATRKNRRIQPDEEEEDPNRMFYTLPSSKAKKKMNKEQRSQEWRVSSSRSSASSSSSSSSYERRSWKRYSETNNSLDSGIHADSCGEHSDHYSP